MIKFKIPATSANLGAGFDALGLAVTLYNEVQVSEVDELFIRSLDETQIPVDETNLVYTTIRHFYNICGKKIYGLRIEQLNRIPITRGLGSSSACIVAGLLAGNMLLGEPMKLDDLVDLAAQMEGHPDNTTPALLGGIVTAVFDGKKVHYVRQEVDSRLRFIAIVPDTQIRTAESREHLPKKVLFSDAVHNLSRAALFSSSLLTGKYENLKVAVDDTLHQPYRMPLISHAKEVFEKCYDLGAYAAYISGSGPTIMAIVDGSDKFFIPVMKYHLQTLGLKWKIFDLTIDNYGTQIL